MTPQLPPRSPPRSKSGRQSAALGCSLLFWVLGAGAAPAAEPALRMSVELARPMPEAGADERELLRIEYKAAQSGAAEADVVGNMLARVRRMDATVADIRRLIDAWPASEEKHAISAPAAAKPLPAAPDSGVTVDITPARLYGLVAVAAALTFLAWMLRERNQFNRRKRRAQAARAVPMDSSVPFDQPTVTAVAPSAAAVAVAAAPRPPPPPEPSVAADPEPVATPPLPPAGEPRPDISAPLDFELITHREEPAPPPAPAAETLPEVEETLELADIMLSMGLAHGAAETLSEQIRRNPKRALYHWLKLLEIYRRSDLREDFEKAATDLRKVFNVQARPWQGTSGGISLEDYPHLAERVSALWPTPACGELLANLLDDNRGGTRNGFPQSVAEEILLLRKIVDDHTAGNAPADAQTGLSSST